MLRVRGARVKGLKVLGILGSAVQTAYLVVAAGLGVPGFNF